MVSMEQNRGTQHEKLQLLRSITNSHALNESSIILDASKYIQELKEKVERLNEDIAAAQSSSDQNSRHKVTVQTVEKGFLVNVYSGKSCPGLLVSVLEAFEHLGLDVLEARVSSADRFHFEAVGGENDENDESISAEEVKQVISDAIQNWERK